MKGVFSDLSFVVWVIHYSVKQGKKAGEVTPWRKCKGLKDGG